MSYIFKNMAQIKLSKIVAFSSQDDQFKAENLLNSNISGSSKESKWIGSKDKDTKQFVIIELEKATRIHQIDIQNQGSAFVEVQVGNSTVSEEDYEVILSPISFMSVNESKTHTNTNRLKYFTHEDSLVKDLADKTWQRIKVVCTQPFNLEDNYKPFGISSIKVYNKVVLSDESKDALKIQTGAFSLKADSLKLDEVKLNDTNVVFNKWKETSNEDSKASSQITAAATTPKTNEPKSQSKVSNEEENKKAPLQQQQQQQQPKQLQNQPTTSAVASSSSSKASSTITSPTKATEANNTKPVKRWQILQGVVFALSGFQNPERSDIRDKGLKMGAKYRPDWTDDCTHLVSAFANTPKAAQVRETGGIVVTKDWLLACDKANKRMDVDDFKLELESDDSSDGESLKPRKAAKNATKKIKNLKKKDEFDDSFEDEEEAENSDDRDFIVNSSDEDPDDDKIPSEATSSGDSNDSDDSKKKKRKNSSKRKNDKKETKKVKKSKKSKKIRFQGSSNSSSSSGSSSSSDSEDIEAYKKKKEKELSSKKKTTDRPLSDIKNSDNKKKDEKPAKKSSLKKTESNRTEANSDLDGMKSNDEDERKKENQEENDDNGWELPTFFSDMSFYIYGGFDEKQVKNVSRLIVAFDGKVSQYMNDDIEYVITDKKWCDEFETSKSKNENIKFVNMDWIMACNKRKRLVAYQPFEITPDV